MGQKFITFREFPAALMEKFIALNLQYGGILKDKSLLNIKDFTLDELVILFELIGEEGLSQNEIAMKIHKNKSTVKRTIDKLEKKKSIVRVRDEKDSRKYNIFLGEEISKVKHLFLQCQEDDVNWIKQCLGEDGYKTFLKQLNILYDKTSERFKNGG